MHNINYKDINSENIGDLAELSAEKLYLLINEANRELKFAKLAKKSLNYAISIKYCDLFFKEKLKLKKNTGILHVHDGNYKITSSVPKKIEWDQKKLLNLREYLEKQGLDPDKFIVPTLSYTVPENKFKKWPETVKEFFYPARTLRNTNTYYTLSPVKTEVK